MEKEKIMKRENRSKIFVPEGKFCYCRHLDKFSNTCKIDGSNRYFYLYCLVNPEGCPNYR